MLVYWVVMKNKSSELTRLDWVGIRFNQFGMFEERFKLLSRWKQCGFKCETKGCFKTTGEFWVLPLLSDSIQSIDQLFHLLHTCPCYQTLLYYFRKIPTPMCKSIHSIDQLQSDSIDYTLSFRKISPCLVIPYKLLISCFIYTRLVPAIRLYTIIF